VLSRYDKPLKLYRRTIKEFQVRLHHQGIPGAHRR
jgi:hypothetical protein